MSSFDRSAHHLAGSGNETGGLIIKKKQYSNREKSDETFKRPSGSVLGLDVLARRKRAEREAEEGGGAYVEKRLRIERKEEKDGYDDSGIRISFGRSDSSKDRRYRAPLLDTPSHPGGVSEEAMEKMHSRMKREQGQGLYASSSTGGGKGRVRDGDRDGRDRNRVGRGERVRKKQQQGQRGDDSQGEDSRRSRERAWEEETPRLERGHGNTTPYPRIRGTMYNV